MSCFEDSNALSRESMNLDDGTPSLTCGTLGLLRRPRGPLPPTPCTSGHAASPSCRNCCAELPLWYSCRETPSYCGSALLCDHMLPARAQPYDWVAKQFVSLRWCLRVPARYLASYCGSKGNCGAWHELPELSSREVRYQVRFHRCVSFP